ncbi:MAG TPA: alpha-amylase family protein [Polyangia bacterium]|nr:alpha-amylase family protein [Polyangia bacterium]
MRSDVAIATLVAALGLVGCGSMGSAKPNSDGSASDARAADASKAIDARVSDVTVAPDAVNDDAPPVPILPAPAPGGAFVHLFEWPWTDVARECETYLGPNGFAAVQVSPPSEHAVIAGYPWWQRYQTVGYELDQSRSGTGAEFRDMVRRCAAVGVAIYVDAVINHMTGQPSGVGSDGTRFTKYAYPNLYAATDFHMPPCAIADSDYVNAPDRVRRCELDGLADLDTSTDHVRQAIAGYLSSLVELGVRGFRVDAAKHIDPADLDAILRLVSARVGAAAAPLYYFEVIDYGGEAIHASDYLTTGQGAAQAVDLIEFKYTTVADTFLGAQGQSLASLRTLGDAASTFLPSERAVVFVNNHDTQRATSLFYQDAPNYDLATVFMLAWPYGYPSILSSYAFDRSTQAGIDRGPPSDATGHTLPIYAPGAAAPTCVTNPTATSGGWLCEHRRPFVARMLAFRKTTAGKAVTNWWDDGGDEIAFGRGTSGADVGFVAINLNATTLHRTFTTNLPAGAYCDLYQGAPTATGCSGVTVTVAGGSADLTVAAGNAVVLDATARAGH